MGSGVGVRLGVTLSAMLLDRSISLSSRSLVIVGVGLKPRISVHSRNSRVSILVLRLAQLRPRGAHMVIDLERDGGRMVPPLSASITHQMQRDMKAWYFPVISTRCDVHVYRLEYPAHCVTTAPAPASLVLHLCSRYLR